MRGSGARSSSAPRRVAHPDDQVITDRTVTQNVIDLTGRPVRSVLVPQPPGRRLGDWRLSDCSLAVTLEPCPMCAGAMINARLDRLIYGAEDPKAGACRSLFRLLTDKRLNHRVTMIGGVMDEKCKKQLQDFFRQRRQQQQRRRSSKSA